MFEGSLITNLKSDFKNTKCRTKYFKFVEFSLGVFKRLSNKQKRCIFKFFIDRTALKSVHTVYSSY